MSATILYIGTTQHVSTLERYWDITVAPSGKRAINIADTQTFDLIIIDADSLRTSGLRICKMIKTAFPSCPLLHIYPKNMDSSKTKVADFMLCAPVTKRTLVGIINRIFDDDTGHTIRCGPFQINPTTRLLRAHGQEIQLNPKIADLLELFFNHPNEVLEREVIMRHVWDTNYMGDTRTLNVHIRHARNVLENGNDKPQYLKTVRGVGYRLEIPPSQSG